MWSTSRSTSARNRGLNFSPGSSQRDAASRDDTAGSADIPVDAHPNRVGQFPQAASATTCQWRIDWKPAIGPAGDSRQERGTSGTATSHLKRREFVLIIIVIMMADASLCQRQVDSVFAFRTMMSDTSNTPAMSWLVFALLTVVSWGLYGVFLHSGQMGMSDPANGRYKAFLFVGLAYFLTAVLAPLAMLVWNGAAWSFPVKGMVWSLVAGIVGAAGAFGVLLAFGAKGSPAVVMSIVFAGAPVVNALYSLWLHPPAGGFQKLPWPFILGLVLAACGGCLVTLYKPNPPARKPAAKAAETVSASAATGWPALGSSSTPRASEP
jgi:uncharacterized membrane protein YeaQ/YmgE (transglycosylase-associated protein family)